MYKLGEGQSRKKRWMIFVSVLLLIGGVVLAAYVMYSNSAVVYVRRFAKQHNTQLLFPDPLPKNVAFAKSSLNEKSGVTTFYFTYDGNKKLIFTEQAKPSNFDFSRLSGDKEFTTSAGKAYIVDMEIRTTASVVGDKTWVVVNAPEKINTDTLQTLLNSLKPLP